MKKIIKALLFFAICLCACTNKPGKYIDSVEGIPSTHQWIYTVKGDTTPYTFIDSAHKYQVGEKIQ